MGTPQMKIAAKLRAEIGGRTVPVRPGATRCTHGGVQNSVPDYLPGGGSVQIVAVDATTGRVGLELPGAGPSSTQRTSSRSR